jgi:predicted nucleic acid-binding protein
MRFAVDKSVTAAWAELDAIHAMASHEFWDEGFGYREVKHDAINGPAQVTDAWLAELARRGGGKLATVDGGLVTHHPDVAVLVPELPTAPEAR